MAKVRTLCLMLWLVACACSCKPGASVAVTRDLQSDTADVYQLVLDHPLTRASRTHDDKVPTRLVILSRTEDASAWWWGDCRPLSIPPADLDGFPELWSWLGLPGMQTATLRDFVSMNQDSRPVDSNVHGNLPTDFDDGSARQTRDWSGFYTRYPGADGLTSFSSIGFNEQRTQALVYLGQSWQGRLILLYHDGSRWRLQDMTQLWVS